MKLISGNSNQPLATAIAKYLGVQLCQATVRRFADMEVFVELMENIRGEDVFVVQPTSFPANDNLMELLITVDALRRSSARRITAVVPYYGYARQDRKTGPRTPITAKLVANLLTTAGVDRVLTLDLHAGQIQGFFDIPVDNLFVAPVFSQHIKDTMSVHGRLPDGLTIISPDVGGVVRARHLAKRLNADLAIIDKRRERAGDSEVMNIIGTVDGRDCIMLDDIVDSAGTLCNADNDLCTDRDSCVGITCTPGTRRNCDDNNPCTADSCNALNGVCVNTPTSEGGACSDGNACTSGDVCTAGACTPGAAASCDDNNSCTVDACNTSTGCTHDSRPPSTSCDDGNVCTTSDTCQGNGSCSGDQIDCDDMDPGTADSCQAGTCIHSTSPGGDGGTSADGAIDPGQSDGGTTPADEAAGCGCRTNPRSGLSASGLLLVLAFALALVVRSRRRS